MKNSRNILWLAVILLAGGLAAAVLDWRQENREAASAAHRSAERMVSLLSLYPLSDTHAGNRQLLVKSLVEQSGTPVAYVVVEDLAGKRLLEFGNLGLRSSSGMQAAVGLSTRPGGYLYRADDGQGDILEFSRALIRADGGGTALLGMRIIPVPWVSSERVRTAATALFLMLAALVVGYYTIVLTVRKWAGGRTLASGLNDSSNSNVLVAMERLSSELSAARDELRRTAEQNADLSSRLGVVGFESEQAYRILDGLDFGILILDARGHVRRANRRMLELLGVKRAAIEGQTAGAAIRHDGVLGMLDRVQDGAAPGAAVMETQFPEAAPDHDFEVACRPLTDAAGDRIGALLTTQDVTRLKLARKAQEDFLAQASHELLTPLTSIKGYTDLLAAGEYDNEEERKGFFNTINAEADRLTDLVRNLLSVSKIESGRLDMERELVKTDWLVDQCLPAVQAAAREKGITITKRLPDVFPTVMGDKDLLKVVIINILGNAVKYTPQGGTIRLSLFQQSHHVCIEIADSGCGIPSEDLPHIFEKFYRGRGQKVRDEVGSGLGLTTALQAAKLHGGTIDVQSEPGKGSTFTVQIPVEEFSLEKR
jgi:PAS domain S-box-containing protein